MESYSFKNVDFTYPEGEKKALRNISFTVQQGEFVILCGPSGCGKSTLLRQLKTALTPSGVREGTVLFDDRPLETVERREQSRRIGFVGQRPDDQIVTDKVWHELAFGPESLGWENGRIRRAVAETASFFGIQTWFHKSVDQLSGGQKQLLNLAAVMVMQPDVLILDEPTAQLDPIAATEFLSTLSKINRETGTAVLLCEHRLDEVLPLADTVSVLDGGRLLCAGTPQKVGQYLKEQGHTMSVSMPTPMQVWWSVASQTACPITVRQGRDWLSDYARENALAALPAEELPAQTGEPVLRAKDAWFRYEKDGQDVVKGLNLTLRKGEWLAVLGGNGTGKTTALKLFSRLVRPYRGTVTTKGRVALLPQDPQTLFVKASVWEDLMELAQDEEQALQMARLCRLESLLRRHPYDLSGGEQQRLALAKILLCRPDILLLDEPTKGLDAQFKHILAQVIQSLLERGVAVLMVSHDVEFCARYAHRCAMFFDGSIVTEDTPRAFFSGNRFYTTCANRMARDVLPEAVTVQDLITACGGEAMQIDCSAPPESPRVSGKPSGGEHLQTPKRRLSVLTRLAIFLVVLLIPLTVFLGEVYLEGRKYSLISLLVLLETMVPFFLAFEGGKPRARELVTVAVLCAVGVAGRTAFFMLPQFKPVLALTILAGVALGSETGFWVGAVTMLCSNMLFGQGPWAPWQMFAMGMIGFLAGTLCRMGLLKTERTALCVFGGFTAIVIYGGIMNPASALMWMGEWNWKVIASYCATGFPMDCIHALATMLFLWFGTRPVLEKLARLKIKYGLSF